jgi:hypothetical protein
MRHVVAVLTIFAILAGGVGLSWLAWSLPRHTPTWVQWHSAAEECSDCGFQPRQPKPIESKIIGHGV